MRRRSKQSGWLILSLVLNGCARTPAAPTAPLVADLNASVQTVPVLVRTIYYSNQTMPFADVSVHVNGSLVGTTRTDGTLSVDVATGAQTTVEVRYPGYRPASASAAVNSPGERWSFWLMQDTE